jgi:hypothetical protein
MIGRIRIQEAQKHANPTDPDPDAACAFDVPFQMHVKRVVDCFQNL